MKQMYLTTNPTFKLGNYIQSCYFLYIPDINTCRCLYVWICMHICTWCSLQCETAEYRKDAESRIFSSYFDLIKFAVSFSIAQGFAHQVKFKKKLMEELLVTKIESVFHLHMTWFASFQLALNSKQEIKTHCSGTNNNCFFSLCTWQIP